jgi:hypothetical protein
MDELGVYIVAVIQNISLVLLAAVFLVIVIYIIQAMVDTVRIHRKNEQAFKKWYQDEATRRALSDLDK